ncbi:MAG: MFS transporter [Bryobacteraceae bacterium]
MARPLLTEPRWLALWAAAAGYMLDAMDVLLYVFALQTIRAEFGLSNAQAGLVGSVSLIASSAGGIAAGVLADRIGRRRTLIYTILLYSLASGGTALSSGLLDLCLWRALVGLGLGGEWSAGAVLVAESWPAEHRAKAIGFMQSGWALGYMLAAAVTALVLPRFGWRVLFLVGILPALLTVWIRRRVREPEIWSVARERPSPLAIFRPPLLRRTVLATALASSVLLAYWGLFTWLPGFLSAPASEGGPGLSVVRTSGWMIAVQVGALLGYWSFGFLADRFGRRPVFLAYVLGAAALTPVYGNAPMWFDGAGAVMLALGPLLGFFGTGYFSLFGAMLAELYPTPVRGAGQGFTYNFGRCLAALAPYATGRIADRSGFGAALALNSGFFLIAAALSFTLPETRRTKLEEV